MKKLFCITLLLAIVIGTIPVSAKSKTKSEKINDYLETSFDVYNVPVVNSMIEFKEQLSAGDVKTAIYDTSKTKTPYIITAKKNGCLLIYCSDGYYDITDVHNKNEQMIENRVSCHDDYGYKMIPIRKKDKIAFTYNTGTSLKMYIGFVPEEKIFNIDESAKNTNGTLGFKFGNVYANDTVLSVYAVNKEYSTKDILINDILPKSYINKTFAYDCSSVAEGNDSILTVQKNGTYTVTVRLSMNGTDIAYDTFILDTDKYISPMLDVVEEPISAVTGTNIIVGYAEPFCTIYIEYDGKKYEGIANRKGIYKIKLKKDMKEGVAFKIWQSNDKLTSKKAKYRVTDLT